ncbi:hypothetical protein HY374_01585 [Candidatus Berkelbacteria bacterium]|nr:hypothetical protein [Candidatus Berkelbacteria bacterium]
MFSRTAIIRTVVWTILALVAGLIPIRTFIGGGQPFTAFEFVGPLGGLYLGTMGALAAVTAKGVGALLAGTSLGLFAVLRWLTPGVAALYLANQRWILWVPVLASAAFLLHPVGRTVPAFATLWLVPLLLWPYREQLLVRSLGATVAAHALGGALFVWLVPTSTTLWQQLLPIAIAERFLFAAGISLSAIVVERVSRFLAVRLPRLRPIVTLQRV